MKSIDWTEWNPDKLPATGTIILAVVRNFRTDYQRYILLNKVDEDDVSFRLYEDETELAEFIWEIVKYKVLDETN